VVGSGSTGNATLVEAGETRLLLDAGLGPRALAERLQSAGVDPASLAGIVLSHEHGDHASGAASFSRRWGVPIFATRGTHAAAGLAEAEHAGWTALLPGEAVCVGGVDVLPVGVPHDAAEPVAFVVSCDGAAFGHATDLGHLTRGLVEAFRRCDAVLVESNYDAALLRDGPYPWSLKERILGARGHLSNADVGRYLAAGLGDSCRSVVLAHLSQKNNHKELVAREAEQALARGGRVGIELSISGPEGTGWIGVGVVSVEVASAGQLRLF
jgi:phosphoribosyl 1,2-cyclic phosphodiesterase